MQLVFGARKIDRVVSDADKLLLAYRNDNGNPYLEYQSTSPTSHLVPEDLAVTLLLNSRVTGTNFRSIQTHGESLNLDQLPRKALEATTRDERKVVAALIAEVANWPAFAASTATKVLHKKRPALIPILDNGSIFGGYMNPCWPDLKPSGVSVKDAQRIELALEWIAIDLMREENAAVWPLLRTYEPRRTLIQIFDSVWWTYYKNENTARAGSQVTARPSGPRLY